MTPATARSACSSTDISLPPKVGEIAIAANFIPGKPRIDAERRAAVDLAGDVQPPAAACRSA